MGVGWWNWRGSLLASANTTSQFVSVSTERVRRMRRAWRIGWIVLIAEVAVFSVWVWNHLYGQGRAAYPVCGAVCVRVAGHDEPVGGGLSAVAGPTHSARRREVRSVEARVALGTTGPHRPAKPSTTTHALNTTSRRLRMALLRVKQARSTEPDRADCNGQGSGGGTGLWTPEAPITNDVKVHLRTFGATADTLRVACQP